MVALRIELSAPWLSAEDGQPALDYRVILSSSYGCRTHPSALKGQCPRTDRRTSRVIAYSQRAQWAGRRSNPRLRLFRPLLDRLSYRPELPLGTKKARCRCDTGLCEAPFGSRPSVNSAADARAAYSPDNRRSYLRIVVLSYLSTEPTWPVSSFQLSVISP